MVNKKLRSRLACAICAIQSYFREFGTRLTFGGGPGTGRMKYKMEQNFRLEIAVGNFGLPLKTFRLFPVKETK